MTHTPETKSADQAYIDTLNVRAYGIDDDRLFDEFQVRLAMEHARKECLAHRGREIERLTEGWNRCAEREDVLKEQIRELVSAVECVVDRYESKGSDEESKFGVSHGIYVVCKNALERHRGGKS